MKLIVNVLIAAALFAGSLFGGLAATGRLNHDGVANIPVLNGLFPAPPADPATAAADAAAAGHGAPVDAHADGAGGAAADAAHADAGQEPQGHGQDGGQEPKSLKRGRSIFQTEEKKGGGGHGGGEEAGAEHGGGDTAGHDAPAEHGGDHGAEAGHAPAADGHTGGHAAERDFDALAEELTQDRKSRYAPGGYFRFDGMPSGITPEQLNEAWKRVQEVMGDLDKRGQSLDLREKSLREFADDIARRQTELGKERVELENLQRRLDERIEQFQEQVKMVRTDEVAGLKRNAQTLASFEPAKAAELIGEQWRTEAGQDEVLKTLEFMDKDAVNSLLQALPNAMIREVLQKRLKVSKEPTPSAGPGR